MSASSSGFIPPVDLAHISAAPPPIDAELERLASFAQQPNYIYNPFIMNTTLTMLLFFIMFNNLLLPVSIPYGGYQLTYNGINHIEESDSDRVVNNEVNRAILTHIESGNTRFTVSLFLHNPANASHNHANMLLFEYNEELKTLTVFHYEPYGTLWASLFPTIAAREKILIDNIIKRISVDKIIIDKFIIHQKLQTIIDQKKINPIQSLTEGGYCIIIALLQAYLFLKYGNKVAFTTKGQTPLGTVIGSNSPSVVQRVFSLAEFQLNVIRGFVIYIGELINQIFAPTGIDVSIATISSIQHIYNEESTRRGFQVPPIYLIYIEALVKYVAENIQKGRIIPVEITEEIGKISRSSNNVRDYSGLTELEDMVMLLLKRNGEGFDLSEREKLRIFGLFDARDRAAAVQAAAIRTNPVVTSATVRATKAKKRVSATKDSGPAPSTKVGGPAPSTKGRGRKGTGGTKKNKKKRRKTKKRRERQRK